MDLSELIKCYSMEHKSLFTVFVIMLPVLFTVLYLYVPEFRDLDFHVQSIFVGAASILGVSASYLGVLACCMMMDAGVKPTMYYVLIPLLIPSSILLLFPDSYGLGYSQVVYVFSHMYLYVFAFWLGVSAILRVVRLFMESCGNIKKEVKETESKD